MECPKCGSKNIGAIENKENGQIIQCNDCGKDWFEEYSVKNLRKRKIRHKWREIPPMMMIAIIIVFILLIDTICNLSLRLPREYEKPCAFLCIDHNMTYDGGNNFLHGGKGCVVCHCKSGDYTRLTVPIVCSD
jgi:hypothetical protein